MGINWLTTGEANPPPALIARFTSPGDRDRSAPAGGAAAEGGSPTT